MPPILTPLRVEPGADLPESLPADSAVLLLPGAHRGALFVEAALQVDGEGATLDAHGRGATVHAAGDEGLLRIVGLRLRGGRSELGACLRVDGDMGVEAEGCVIEAGLAGQGGDAVGALRGRLRLVGCQVLGELMLTGVAEAELVNCVVEGDLKLREGASLRLVGGAVRGTLDLRGTTTRAPTCTVEGTALAALRNDPRLPGLVMGVSATVPGA